MNKAQIRNKLLQILYKPGKSKTIVKWAETLAEIDKALDKASEDKDEKEEEKEAEA